LSKTLLITGGTGTFGKAFVRLFSTTYRKIIIFSRDEFKQHNMHAELVRLHGDKYVNDKFRFFLGDVRDIDRLRLAFRGVDAVVHAAALKHVPFCEYNPSEALLTNVTGTKNVCDAAIEAGVKNVVCLSTDKAVEPINFYGSTKMLAERYAIHSNVYGVGRTKLACVRYGNIVGSRGSIVEIFRNLPKDRPFDITHPDMTRFWMHIDSAANMVDWTLKNMHGGEIVIPNIKAATVVDLARAIDPDREQRIVGIRSGEKMHEQLIHRREYETMFAMGPGCGMGYSSGTFYNIVTPESADFTPLREYYDLRLQRFQPMTYASNDANLQMTPDEIEAISKA
jgi:UDP-N-acetylglucosamine 4,6-dehydratase